MKSRPTILALAAALLLGTAPVYANDLVSAEWLDHVAGAPEEQDDTKEQEQDDIKDQDQDQDQDEMGQDQGLVVQDPTARGGVRIDLGPSRPYYRTTVCFAENAAGRTFRAMGRGVSARRVQARAVWECRENSAFFLSRSCRPLGCRTR